MKVLTGLEALLQDSSTQKKISGNVGLLCHQASVDSSYCHSIVHCKAIFKRRLKKLFGPQHGIVGDVQDNMIESDHFHHSYFDLPIYSLYSETRIPTSKMLQGLDHVIIDLQDVGTRIYTFIYTMTYMMEVCGKMGIEVIVLDRPNPIGGECVEGNILAPEWTSFVGRHPLPTRHGMTIGEVALWAKRYCSIDCDVRVIKMQCVKRGDYFAQTGLPWVPPSPNLPTAQSTLPFVGTVLFEGTQLSEGRGTTRPLEIVGYPQFCPWKHLKNIQKLTKDLSGFVLRPMVFRPMFQKHAQKSCGGYHIHVTDAGQFRPWRLAQLLCQYFYHNISGPFWKDPPYEYEYERLPIHLINGTDRLGKWVEQKGNWKELLALEQENLANYLEEKKSIELY